MHISIRSIPNDGLVFFGILETAWMKAEGKMTRCSYTRTNKCDLRKLPGYIMMNTVMELSNDFLSYLRCGHLKMDLG